MRRHIVPAAAVALVPLVVALLGAALAGGEEPVRQDSAAAAGGPSLAVREPTSARAPSPGGDSSLSGPPEAGVVLWAELDDVIGTIAARYLTDAVKAAEDRDARALVIQLDTPGGLDTAMREIIKAILASRVPVAVYIAPEGARAASAGVYISYSAHVAAMAPGTNLGAATPVNMGGPMDSTMAAKVTNDAAAYIEGLATLRGRNAEWAIRAVREAVSLTSDHAVEQRVVDFVATGPRDLLRRMDGRTVKVHGDSALAIRSAEAEIVDFPRSLRYRILSILNNPNVAYLLLLLGFYGLFFELSNPGAVFPGVMGAICLVLGLFALQSLDINYAGLLLMAIGVILFLLETQVTSHGVLSIGGTVALLAGSILLVDAPAPYLRVSLQVIIPAVVLTAAFFVFALAMAIRAQRRRVVSGREGLVGMIAEARTPLLPRGKVFVAGEHWDAVVADGSSLPPGARVEVVAVDHLRLTVKPAP